MVSVDQNEDRVSGWDILQIVKTSQISDGWAGARDTVVCQETWIHTSCATFFLSTLFGLLHRLRWAVVQGTNSISIDYE